MRKLAVCTGLVLLAALALSPLAWGADTIRIGFNIPLTGDAPKVGECSKYAAEIRLAEINAAGGLKVGDKTYKLEFIYVDNESKAESATAAALKLITQDRVLGIIGPQASKQAIPAGQVCNDNKTPMISPWSTNPKTTENQALRFQGLLPRSISGTGSRQFCQRRVRGQKSGGLV